jgi:hypothetical protein
LQAFCFLAFLHFTPFYGYSYWSHSWSLTPFYKDSRKLVNLVMLCAQGARKETSGYNKQTFGYIHSPPIIELYIIKNSNNESNKDL